MDYDTSKHPHLASWRERRQSPVLMALRCPACRRKGYKPYLWPDGTMISDECGRCDHESSCGYHVTPKEWFRLHPDGRDDQSIHSPATSKPLPPPPPRVRVPQTWAERFYCLNPGAGRNPLLRYWTEFFRQVAPGNRGVANMFLRRMHDALRAYMVGTLLIDGTGYTIWWIVDETGEIRSGKAMRYKTDGHRDKECPRAFIWMHYLPEIRRDLPPRAEYVSCLFGLHRLTAETREVQLVESEKTAVLMTVFRPDLTWMATMGKSNLNAHALGPLIDRGIAIVCHPDTDGYEKWEERAREIRKECPRARIRVSRYVMYSRTNDDAENADILDLMEREYRHMYKQEVDESYRANQQPRQ